MQVKDYHGKSVIDSREVAEMVEKRHDHLLRDITGYIKIMEKANAPKIGAVGNELNFQPVDFFIPSNYQDSKGETRPCYLITKKGCDMIANKLTGEKGVLFTAAYVTAFEAMKRELAAPSRPPEVSPGGLAKLIGVTRRVMLDMGKTPVEVGAMTMSILNTWCIPVPTAFSKEIPGQLCLFERSTEGKEMAQCRA